MSILVNDIDSRISRVSVRFRAAFVVLLTMGGASSCSASKDQAPRHTSPRSDAAEGGTGTGIATDDATTSSGATTPAAKDQPAASGKQTAEASPLPASAGCTPEFAPYDARFDSGSLGQFMGADAAYSVELGGGKSAWFFGDTFLNRGGIISRTDAKFVGNTLAIGTCDRGKHAMLYYWNLSPSLALEPFFKTNVSDTRYWPGAPFIAGTVLYVPLMRVKDSTGGLGFSVVGTDIAQISNPTARPDQWSIRYLPLSGTLGPGTGTGAGAASVISGRYVYLFNAGVGPGNIDTSLFRLPVAALASAPSDVKSLIESLNTNGQWVAGYDNNNVKYLGLHANSGATVRFHKPSGKWLALYTDLAAMPAKQVVVATAKTLEGPWSAPQAVFQIPESTPGNPAYRDSRYCYAAYEHLEYNPKPDTAVAFTYNCNDFKFDTLKSDLSLYFPRFVQAALPPL